MARLHPAVSENAVVAPAGQQRGTSKTKSVAKASALTRSTGPLFSIAEDEELLPAADDEVVVDAKDPYLKSKRLFKKENDIFYKKAKSLALEYGKVMCEVGCITCNIQLHAC